jgi:hypothetical protein
MHCLAGFDERGGRSGVGVFPQGEGVVADITT